MIEQLILEQPFCLYPLYTLEKNIEKQVSKGIEGQKQESNIWNKRRTLGFLFLKAFHLKADSIQ